MGLSSFGLLPIIAAEDNVASGLGTADFSSVLSTITGILPTSTILGVITALLGATVVFGFLWWGARYGVRKLMAAIKGSKVSV